MALGGGIGFIGRHIPASCESPVINDPVFYVAAAVAVLFLGLGKGGFSGVGMAATPLLALFVPPLQAVAIVLPILLLQDVLSVWVYRRDWDAWNLKVMLPGSVLGVAAGWAFAAYVSDAQMRLALGLISLVFLLNVWIGGRDAPARRPGWFSGVFWGAGCGFTSTISHAGARGLMQVMPFWLEEIGRPDANLFVIDTNIRFGCTILKYYMDMENGDLVRALGRYHGSLGRPAYPNKVLDRLRNKWFRL